MLLLQYWEQSSGKLQTLQSMDLIVNMLHKQHDLLSCAVDAGALPLLQELLIFVYLRGLTGSCYLEGT